MAHSKLWRICEELLPEILAMLTIAGIYFYRRKQLPKVLVLIPLLLAFVVVGQLIGSINRGYWRIDFLWSLWYGGQIKFIEYLFYVALFLISSKNALYRRWLVWSMPFAFACCLVDAIVFNGQSNSYLDNPFQGYYSHLLEKFLISLWAALYIFELVNSDQISLPITKIPMFWVSFAVLVSNSAPVFVEAVEHLILARMPENLTMEDIATITPFMILFRVDLFIYYLYLLLLIRGFVWRQQK